MKPDKEDILFTPSPGKYNANDLSIKSPSWKIGQTKRILTHVFQKTPGCGKYEYKSFIGEGPKYSFSKRIIKDEENKNEEKKLEKKNNAFIVPGPGSYNIKDSNLGKKYSMGYRRIKKIKSSKSPPVGAYNIRKESDFVVPSSRFGKGKRDNLELNRTAIENPGPGQYTFYSERTCSSSPKWSFGKKNYNNNKFKNFPGPGSYKINTYIGKEGKKYSFGKDKYNHSDAFDELSLKRTLNYPNPTTYQNQYFKYIPNSPQWSMLKLIRKCLSNDKFKINLPGPDKYSPDYKKNSIYKKLPIWSFYNSDKNKNENDDSNKKSKKIRFNTPPPGYYTVKNGMIPQGLKYSIYGRPKNEKIEDKLGPGEYNIKYDGKQNEPKFTFGKEDNRINFISKENFPGPGSYNIKDNSTNKQISFSPIVINKKIFKKKKYLIPGPGHYKIPTSFDNINDMTREKGFFDPTFRYI